jgi:hypothetical protein
LEHEHEQAPGGSDREQVQEDRLERQDQRPERSRQEQERGRGDQQDQEREVGVDSVEEVSSLRGLTADRDVAIDGRRTEPVECRAARR